MASSFCDTALRLLLSCAKAIEVGDLKSADAFLHDILILADQRYYSCHTWKYGWKCNIDAGESNNIIRRHPALTEWQHLFSMAGFSQIPLNHSKDNLEIMGEEEECLILGYEGCPMFFLSAWKPKVEYGHFNSHSDI
ncbi:hypothetical protein GOBAR_AA19498 [Gossypium barbadense]|uniref:Uncharacterized protein n=1 Tax=Gossypium barbadense TaxID=3634 RepID=A0A2P5XCU3_GOSBA|nr:hypothetical protein GOBAR_AA19498 [Gossypium barbadense]